MRGAGRRGAGVRAVALAVTLGCLVVGPAAGSATGATDPSEGGLWYFTVPGFADIHASGITGAGITVAVIDGPVNAEAPDLVGTNLILPETAFCDEAHDGDDLPDPATSTGPEAEHATGLISLIVGTGVGVSGQPGVRGVAPGATVRPYIRSTSGISACELNGQDGAILAIDQAVADGANIISLSFSGWGSKPDALAALARAQRAGVIIVASSAHDGGTELGWPALANGVIAVEAADVTMTLTPNAVAHPQLTVVAPGIDIRGLAHAAGWQGYGLASGTSPAAAWTSGVLALAWSAHPEATANQMIQALLRTTAQSDGNLTRVDDHWGYGAVSARNLVAIDPTGLPDVNPLLSQDPDARPRYTDVIPPEPTEPTPEATAEATKEPSAEPTTAITPAPDPAPASVLPAIAIGALALLVLAGATTAALLARRRTTTPPAPPGQGS